MFLVQRSKHFEWTLSLDALISRDLRQHATPDTLSSGDNVITSFGKFINTVNPLDSKDNYIE